MSQELYTLPVSRVDEHAKVYIVEYEGKLYRVHMVPEQIGKEKPETIVCNIEKKEELVFITQNMEMLLRKHYTEGDEVMYRIERVSDTYYLLKDEYGYTTYLDKKYKINPTITPQLRCRVISINNKRVNVELIEKISLVHSHFTISSEYIRNLFDLQSDYSESITQLLLSDDIIGSFDSVCHRWIYSICQKNGADKKNLDRIKEACLCILGKSDLLKLCNPKEREVLEDRFTTLIEQLGYYIHALICVEEGNEVLKIDELLNTLQNTGYVFHPKKNFYIMMCIFLIKSKEADGQHFLDIMMPKIFDTLRSCDISNWKRQPFKLVWIKLLDFLIESLKQDEDKLFVDKVMLGNMVQALALQYNLTEEDDEGLIDSRLNLSMFYRHCAHIGVINPMQMLDVAYYTLIGAIQEEPSMINNTNDPDRMACVIANQISKFTPDATLVLKYEGKNADLLLENNSVRVVPKEYNPENTYDVIPEHLNLWKNLQIEQNSKIQAIGKNQLHSIKPYKERWVDAERELLDTTFKQEPVNKNIKLAVDDEVGIIITRQTAAETPTFECKVVDSNGIDADGTIRMADMVGYATPSVGLFSFELNGNPLILDAKVIGINTDGTFQFGTKTLIDDLCDEYRYNHINYNDSIYCVVTGGNTLTPFYAVSDQGFSVTVRYEEGDLPVQMDKGTVIQVTNIEASGKPGFISGTFKTIANEKKLTLADAFGTLMRLYSGGETYQIEQVGDDAEFMVPDLMDKSGVIELINLIDNVASLDNDYIKAYNYLGFCRIVAHVIEESKLVAYYQNKMALIELLYEFDVNNCISEDLIKRFETSNAAIYEQYTTLGYQFRKLQIISYLGQDSHNRELCEMACDMSNPDFAQLAQLILSYNFMQNTNMAAQASDIQGHIKELLKLQKKDNPKKDYGQETFTQEFKTSIICPPDTMRPDPMRQTHRIMEEICAFLNAEGGVLYIGVDDKTHLERGIEEDLKHPLFEGSKDKYDTYVRNKINQMLVPGELADHYIRTSFDEEAHLPVYVIRIFPCPRPVSIDNEFYERRGTSSRHVTPEYLTTFISNRIQNASSIEQAKIDEVIQTAQATEAQVVEEESADFVLGSPLDYSADIGAIHTSEVRRFRHKDDGMQPEDLVKYINIYNDNTYSITPQLLYDCLSLGIYEDEYKESLVVVYETGEISRIPMEHLLHSMEWKKQDINNKLKIVFVSPARSADILSVKFRSKNTEYYRFFTVGNLEEGTFNSGMRSFYNGVINAICECEILPITDTRPYKNILDIDKNKLGVDVTRTDGKKAAALIQKMLGREV